MIEITLRKNGMVDIKKPFLGREGENLQENIVVKFEEDFIDGVCRIEYENSLGKFFVNMTKEDETYTLPVKSQLTSKDGRINMQIVITESEEPDGIPIYKSNIFYMMCNNSINANVEGEEYETLLDIIEEKIAEVEHLNIEAERVSDGVEINITDKTGEVTTTKVYDGESGNKSYTSLERLDNYLYKISFDTLPELNSDLDSNVGYCSSFVQNGKLHRNLDWTYAETAEFIVQTKNFKGMSYINGMNDSNLDEEKIKKLPYQVCDGVNNSGIMVSTHVLYNDWEYSGSGEKNVNILNIPFLILNNITSLENFETEMEEYLSNIMIPEGLSNMEYLLHFMVTDGTNTYVIEPPESSDGNYVVIDATSNPKLTNFRWVNRNVVNRTDNDIQMRPTGIERWNAIPCDLEDIKFTNAYETPNYLSEFIGERDTNKYSTDEELLELYEIAREIYLDRQRDGSTWHTMHSIIYSQNGIETLHIQENFEKGEINKEPDTYLKNAVVSGNTLTLKNKDNTTVSFTPTIEGGITDVKVNGSSVVSEGVAIIENMATTEDIPTKLSDLTNDEGFITNSYHDNTKQDKLTEGKGIIINENNVITYDEVEVSSVDYVDANISDTMNFIIQERNTERTARIAGDDSLQEQLDDVKEDISGLGDDKQDKLTSDNAGSNITITKDEDDNVIISADNTEPEAYLKSASVSGNTLTITKDDDTTLSFTPAVEGGITDVTVNGTSVVDDGVATITNMATTDDIPTKTSDLANDSNFVVDANYIHTDNNYTTVEKTKLAGLENYDDTDILQDISDLQDDVDEVNEKIPAQASSSNQLADKDFVNSSIATQTSYFRGTYESIDDLPTTGVTPNDYAFIIIYDSVTSLVKQYDRYKYNGTSWVYEYTLNNSSFTASQWASINSGITSNVVSTVSDNTERLDDVDTAITEINSDITDLNNGLTEVNTELSNINTTVSGHTTSISGLSTRMDQAEVNISNVNQNKQDKITSSNKLSYSLISDTPEIPTKTSDLTNDSGFITNTYKATSDTLGLVKPDGTTITIDSNGVISGSEGTTDYDDLDNKPSINDVTLTGNKTLAQIGAVDLTSFNNLSQEVTNISNTVDTHDILIPNIDGTASSALSMASLNNEDIIVFKTSTFPGIRSDISALDTNKQDAITSSNKLSYSLISDTPDIPTKTSDLTNDSGFIDSSYHDDDKQDKEDDGLDTDDKTVIGGINEVNSIAKLSNKAKGYTNYQSLITELNDASSGIYNVGQSFLIQTLDVPDLWVISIENTSQTYTYTTDAQFVTDTSASGGVQVGYYKLGQLETLKQDLTNYVTNTDYATQNVGGVIKITSSYGTQFASDKKLRATIVDYSDYNNMHNNAFIGKQTLENVITGKGLISNTYHDNTKQDTLVSGTNIKTINNTSILGSGNIEIQSGGAKVYTGSSLPSDSIGNDGDIFFVVS